MARDTLQDIAASASDFDIHSIESEDDAAQRIEEMGGDSDTTDPADQDAPDAIPFADAVSVVEGAQSDSFHVFRAIAEDLMTTYVAEGKSAKATQDHRTYHATMAQGIENVLVALSEHIEAAKQRVQAGTSEEKRHLGVNVKRVINVGPSSLEEPNAEPFHTNDGQSVGTLGGMKVVSAVEIPRPRK